MVDHWQTLIAGVIGGVLTLVAGVIAYRAARRSANAQVAAVQSQIADLRAERQRTDERRLRVIKWAVTAEGKRLEIEATTLRRALPGPPQGDLHGLAPAQLRVEELIIKSSPLLRGELDALSLLDDITREHLQELAGTLDEYNVHIRSRRISDMTGGPMIENGTLVLIDRLIEKAAAVLLDA